MMVVIRNLPIVSMCLLLLVFANCSKKKEFQFCFSSIVYGITAVSPIKIGNSYAPCGVLTSYAEIDDNNYDFSKQIGACGKMADGYKMEIPDSAWLEWGVGEGVMYNKNLKMPEFPRLKPNEKYRVGFVIGYQDCVYVWIQKVPRY